jgi:hypothetical protein
MGWSKKFPAPEEPKKFNIKFLYSFIHYSMLITLLINIKKETYDHKN